jgi:Domain of unknown function (DUF4386)
VLAVTLFAITRDVDRDLAMLAMICRVVEGVIVGLSVSTALSLRWLATITEADTPNPVTIHTPGEYLLRNDSALTATFFSVGSLLFACLFLRGRSNPLPLARLGIVASALLVVGLPSQLAGFLGGSITSAMWLPMLVFDIALAIWLIVRGVADPALPS